MSAQEYFPDARVASLADAACSGEAAAVHRLIAAGVDVNGGGKDGITPLAWVVRCGNAAGVNILLKSGANPNHHDRSGATPFLSAVQGDDQSILNLLIEAGADLYQIGPSDDPAIVIALNQGVGRGKWQSYYALLAKGIDINRVYGPVDRDTPGTTIALHAVMMGRFDKVIELIERGYRANLGEIAIAMHIHHTDPKSPAWHQKQLLLTLLEKRGVPYDQITTAFERGDRSPHLEQY